MDKPTGEFSVPIWLSRWTFKDQRNHIYTLDNHIVKGHDKGSIFTNKEIVNKAVNKLVGRRSKRKLVPVNLTLISQHGYGVKET
tara:strand:- start:5531 stop:5782 length:252 start_codon:yes stop_codon:yes gene_type:complete